MTFIYSETIIFSCVSNNILKTDWRKPFSPQSFVLTHKMSVQISSNRLVETYSLITKSVQSRESKVEGTSKGALEKDEEDEKEGRVRKREQGVSFHLGKKLDLLLFMWKSWITLGINSMLTTMMMAYIMTRLTTSLTGPICYWELTVKYLKLLNLKLTILIKKKKVD